MWKVQYSQICIKQKIIKQDMKTYYDSNSNICQIIYEMFCSQISNEDILKQIHKIASVDLIDILKIEIQVVLNQIQNRIQIIYPLNKDHEYQQRKKQLIQQISGSKRLIFNGNNSNYLGQNTLKIFLKICKYYMENGNLNNFQEQSIIKLFKRWLSPGRQKLNKSNVKLYPENSRVIELLKKKKQLQKLEIQYDILLKKSEIISVREEISLLQDPKISQNAICKLQQNNQQNQQIQNNLIQKAGPQYQTQQVQNEITPQNIFLKIKTKAKQPLGINKQRIAANPKLRWKKQQQSYFIQLFQKYTTKDQLILLKKLQQAFGKSQKFSVYTIRDKKFYMFRQCRQRCISALAKKKYLTNSQLQLFAKHFENIDNVKAFQFITNFLYNYYYIDFNKFNQKDFKIIIDDVFQQQTRVLAKSYLNRMKFNLYATQQNQLQVDNLKTQMPQLKNEQQS